MKKSEKQVVSVYVDTGLWAKVRRVSDFTKESLSAIVTTALNFYFSYRKGEFTIVENDPTEATEYVESNDL